MGNETLKSVAKVVRDLLTYNEQLIKTGRQNFEREQFEIDYIVIDSLSPMLRVASNEEFDGVSEKLDIGDMYQGVVTLDFYGSNAYATAINLGLLMRSQAALELKRSNGINMYQMTGITDVKALTGQQYGERVQIEFNVEFNANVLIDTLRINTAQIEIRSEGGIEYAG